MDWRLFLALGVVALAVMFVGWPSLGRESFKVGKVKLVISMDDTLLIDTENNYTDYRLRERLLASHSVKIVPMSKNQLLSTNICSNNRCDFTSSHRTATTGLLPPIHSNVLIRENFLNTAYVSVPMHVEVHVEVEPGKPLLVSDLLMNKKQISNIKVFFQKSKRLQDYSLHTCSWDEASKTATCEKMEWSIRESIPDIDTGRPFDIIRIAKKAFFT